jgi:hypothetical protein
VKNGDSLDKIKKDYTDQIEVLRKVALAGGITKKEFDGLLATLLATPDQVVTNLVLAGVPDAMNALEPYSKLLDAIDPDKRTLIEQVGAEDATRAIELLNEELDKLPSDKKLKAIGESLAAQGIDPLVALQGRSHGGIDYPMKRYALGGIAADKSPRIVPAGSNVRLFGEPETGGEAFIPLAADSRRGRAVDITSAVAGKFGFDLMPKGSMTAGGFDDARMVNVLAQGFSDLSGQLGAVRDTVASMEAGVTVNLSGQVQSPEAQGARAGQAFRQVARSR